MVIAIDGPAGAGKSTVARAVADRLGFTYLDTGAMYRSVAFVALRAGVDPGAAEEVARLAHDIEVAVGERVIVRFGTTPVVSAGSISTIVRPCALRSPRSSPLTSNAWNPPL